MSLNDAASMSKSKKNYLMKCTQRNDDLREGRGSVINVDNEFVKVENKFHDRLQ